MDRQNATAKRDTVEEDDCTETLGGRESDSLEYIREYAIQVVRGSEWPLCGVDLSATSFEIRHRAQRRHGVAVYNGDGNGDSDGDGGKSGDTGSEATSLTSSSPRSAGLSPRFSIRPSHTTRRPPAVGGGIQTVTRTAQTVARSS